jgi:hypothetical protein
MSRFSQDTYKNNKAEERNTKARQTSRLLQTVNFPLPTHFPIFTSSHLAILFIRFFTRFSDNESFELFGIGR